MGTRLRSKKPDKTGLRMRLDQLPIHKELPYRGYAVGVASRLATVIYVATVMPILYDNSYSPLWELSIKFYGEWQNHIKLHYHGNINNGC